MWHLEITGNTKKERKKKDKENGNKNKYSMLKVLVFFVELAITRSLM